MRITEIFGLKKQKKKDLHLRTESDEDRIQMVFKQTDDLTWFQTNQQLMLSLVAMK